MYKKALKKFSNIIFENNLFSRFFKKLFFLFLIILAPIQGCFFVEQYESIKGKGNIKLEEVKYFEITGWEEDDHKLALNSFLHSCNKFAKMPQERNIGGSIGKITAGDFRDVCDIGEVVKIMNNAQAKNFFENWFRPFLVTTRYGKSQGVFTGYYEASLNGSLVQNDRYKYPIYAKPNDLDNNPYLTREEIEDGALKDKGLELLYVDDKVDLFFMHIQGSGRVNLEDGREIRVAYADKNNQPFIAIGNHMADKKYLRRDNINAATIKEWLKNNPEKMDEVMNVNARFVFFRIANMENIVGGQGVPLTPERSLAVDKSIIPYGMPLFLNTQLKLANGKKIPYNKLLIAQDTGSAITGAVRGDIFFGYGKTAEEKAYYMASRGEYFMLLPVNIANKLTR